MSVVNNESAVKNKMSLVIGESAVKIYLIQASPGYEKELVSDLKAKCDDKKKKKVIKNYKILLGVGSFDVVLICQVDNFDPLLTDTGPLNNIQKISRLFSFQYIPQKGTRTPTTLKQFFEQISKASFIGFRLVKLDPSNRCMSLVRDALIVDHLSSATAKASKFVFGSLGWNEVVLVDTNDDINEIITEYLSVAQITSQKTKILNTYSFLATNTDESPTTHPIQIDSNIKISIMVSANPNCYRKLVAFCKNNSFKIRPSLGREDFVLEPMESITWHFLDKFVNDLRDKFRNTIFSTNTIFSCHSFPKGRSISQNLSLLEPCNGSCASLSKRTTKFFKGLDIDINKFNKCFDSSSGIKLANTLNDFSNLVNHHVIGDAFVDMVPFIYNVKQAVKVFYDETLNNDNYKLFRNQYANQVSGFLRYAAEQRLYGTHGTIDESIGRFTKLRGGTQKILLALECIPTYIFKTYLQIFWHGFVFGESTRGYLTSKNIIVVPLESFWDPQSWWVLYHETGHQVYEYICNDRTESLRKVITNDLLKRKNFTKSWETFYEQVFADLFAFTLGINDITLYQKLFWQYKFSNTLRLNENKSNLLLRSFLVALFDNYTKNGIQITDENQLYQQLTAHIQDVCMLYKNSAKKEEEYLPHNEEYFISSSRIEDVLEIYPFFEKIKEIFVRKNLLTIGVPHHNTVEVLTHIKDGKEFKHVIDSPIEVLKYFLQNDNWKYDEYFALVLSFEHQQRRYLSKIKESYDRKK